MPSIITDCNGSPDFTRDAYMNENGRKWWFKARTKTAAKKMLKKHGATSPAGRPGFTVDFWGPDFFAMIQEFRGKYTLHIHFPTAAVRKRMLRGEDC